MLGTERQKNNLEDYCNSPDYDNSGLEQGSGQCKWLKNNQTLILSMFQRFILTGFAFGMDVGYQHQ